MTPDTAHDQLGWPKWEEMTSPQGAGPRVYVELAKRKLAQVLSTSGTPVEVGVLTVDPSSGSSEAPVAVVCRFPRRLAQDELSRLLKLAWSFCRTPLLITIEPALLRAWTCYEQPPTDRQDPSPVETLRLDEPLGEQAARSLQWVELASGRFFRDHAHRFQVKQRADLLLLENLKWARSRLFDEGLAHNYIHDLLARLIFVQFLFHRKDSAGKPALNQTVLSQLHERGDFHCPHGDLAGILRDHEDTYRFFKWLDTKFNGDLFPGKGSDDGEREAEWQREMQAVTAAHLAVLADFVSGDVAMGQGQYSLWPLYAFDAIPLEFISSIYQEFVDAAPMGPGEHYTPSHWVDYVLDGVLPWDATEWDLKILDPACGSGVFLVKAFQRLVHRWRRANTGREPPAALLKRLLERNLVGVDINEDAVRVASFSLYLAMCDEIDPKWYWTQVKFPVLRGRRLLHADFFSEDMPCLRTEEDSGAYDLVVGNAPWGKHSVTPDAYAWAQARGWPVANKQVGTLFLPKAAALCAADGRVSMLQPAGALLFNREGRYAAFRQKLFSSLQVDSVTNLSALRFIGFNKSLSPVCAITLRPSEPDGEFITYYCPKRTHTTEDDYRIAIEPHDCSAVSPWEASHDPWAWTALAWGGRRDLALLRRLRDYPHLGEGHGAVSRKGIVRGDREKHQPELLGRRLIETEMLPPSAYIHLDPEDLPTNTDDALDRKASTDTRAFETPQLIVKKSWSKQEGRFRAYLVAGEGQPEGVVCSQSYISVHVPKEEMSVLEAACLSCNSVLAPYYLLLTSGRFASYRPEVEVGELRALPIPRPAPGLLEGISEDADLDERIHRAFDFTESEWALVEDLVQYTLPDFKGDAESPGRQPTRRISAGAPAEPEPDLSMYADYFLRVLRAGFGAQTAACVTVFHDGEERFPLRLLAVHLGCPGRDRLVIETIRYSRLAERISGLGRLLQPAGRHGGGSRAYERVARIYDSVWLGGQAVPTVYIAKPDQLRYWTRSAALRDADALAADVMTWSDQTPKAGGGSRGEPNHHL